MRRWTLAFVVIAMCAPYAQARDIFVNNLTGNDRYVGDTDVLTSDGGPVRSISRALYLTTKGDRIVLAPTSDPYRESITISGGDHSGYPFLPFVLAGNGAVLDGSRPVRERVWEHFRGDVFRFQPERMAYQQLFREGKPVERVYLKSPLGIPPLEPIEWCLRDGYIYFRVEPGRLPDDYKLSYASETVGITLYQAHHIVVSDLTVQGFQLDGINAHDSVTDCLLTGITARGNGRAGIAIGGSSRVELDSCLLGNNGAAQLLVQALATVSVEATQLLPASAPAVVQQGQPRLFIDGLRQKSE